MLGGTESANPRRMALAIRMRYMCTHALYYCTHNAHAHG